MAKMHEVIAAEPAIAATYNSMVKESLKVFDKPDHFTRTVTSKTHFDSESSHLDITETKDLVTTVMDRLKYVLEGSFVSYIDLQFQKDSTNQLAKADLVLDGGQVLVKDVPATMLLQLEKELAGLRNMVSAVPTLQAGPIWTKDESEGLYVTSEPQVSFSTKKTMRPVVLVPATDKHPAQVEKINEDVPIAKIERRVWSGMLTSREKADILGRIDSLLVAAKRARQRANSTEAPVVKMGKVLSDFILSGSVVTEK